MRSKLSLIAIAMLVGCLLSCQVQESANYADLLEDCLEDEDIQLLNSLTSRFEKHIKSTYGSNINEAYIKYLRDVATFNLPSNFFNYSTFKSDVNELRSSHFFRTQMVRQSSIEVEGELTEIPPADGDEYVEEEFEPMTFKPDGEYLKCLVRSNKIEALNDYFEILTNGIDISPSLLAEILSDKLALDEVENPLTRLIIAINFHYELSLVLTEG